MIAGISIYEIFTLTSILFFIGIYGFITRKNLISILISLELMVFAFSVILLFRSLLMLNAIQIKTTRILEGIKIATITSLQKF